VKFKISWKFRGLQRACGREEKKWRVIYIYIIVTGMTEFRDTISVSRFFVAVS